MSPNKAINCLKCRHYFITHNPKTPKGCKAYAFQSLQIPSVVVKKASGKECLAFESKRVAASPIKI